MCDSACRWTIFEIAKLFSKLCETLLNRPTANKYGILISLCNQVFMNLTMVIVDKRIKVNKFFLKKYRAKQN